MDEYIKFMLMPMIATSIIAAYASYNECHVYNRDFGKFVYDEARIRSIEDTKKEYFDMLDIDVKNEKISFTSKCDDGNTYHITVEKKVNK